MATRARKVRWVSNPHDPLPRLDTSSDDEEVRNREDDAAPPRPSESWFPTRDADAQPQPHWTPVQPYSVEATEAEEDEHEFHHPLDKVTGGLPRRLRIAVDWIVTIVGAIAIVLAIKAWVVNPYRIPSSSMEPTLHCARPAQGCEARFSDRVLANRFIYHFESPKRGDVIVFNVPLEAEKKCGAGGTFVKRIIGLPGDTLQIRVIHGAGYVYINGQKLDEPYIQQDRRDIGPAKTYHVPRDDYFMMGDNRASSCDSRSWGPLPRENIIGKVFMTYWPPNRISFR
jgi:signal peptidase I